MLKLWYCDVKMPKDREIILKYTQCQKPIKTLFIVYADTESLLGKMYACKTCPEYLSKTKVSKHTT